MKQHRKQRERVYSDKLITELENRVPRPVLDKLKEHGWNCFGIYETVKELLSDERKQRKKQVQP